MGTWGQFVHYNKSTCRERVSGDQRPEKVMIEKVSSRATEEKEGWDAFQGGGGGGGGGGGYCGIKVATVNQQSITLKGENLGQIGMPFQPSD